MVDSGMMLNGTWYPATSSGSGSDMVNGTMASDVLPQENMSGYGGYGPNPFYSNPYGYGMPPGWMSGMNEGMMFPNGMLEGARGAGINNGYAMNFSPDMMQQNMMMYMQMQQYAQQMQGSQGVQMDGPQMQVHAMQQAPQPYHQNQHIPNHQQQGPPASGNPSQYRAGTFLESDLVHIQHTTADTGRQAEGLPEVLRHLSLSPSQSELSNTSTAPVVSAPVSEASCSSLPSCDAEINQAAHEIHIPQENVSQQMHPQQNNNCSSDVSPEKMEREKAVDERITRIREKNARDEEKRKLAMLEVASEDGSSATESVTPSYKSQPAAYEAQAALRKQRETSRDVNNRPYISHGNKPMRGQGRGGRGGYIANGVRGGRGGSRSMSDGRTGFQAADEKEDDGWHTVTPRFPSKNRPAYRYAPDQHAAAPS